MTEALLSNNKALGTLLQEPGGTVCMYVCAHVWQQLLDRYGEKKEKKRIFPLEPKSGWFSLCTDLTISACVFTCLQPPQMCFLFCYYQATREKEMLLKCRCDGLIPPLNILPGPCWPHRDGPAGHSFLLRLPQSWRAPGYRHALLVPGPFGL